MPSLDGATATLAIRTSGEDAVRQAMLEASQRFRTAHRSFRIESEWRDVTPKA